MHGKFASIHVALAAALVTIIASPSIAAGPDDSLDELTVRGERSLRSLHSEMVSAQDRVFSLLNDMLDDEFHVVCRYERPTGSHISRRVCRTRYAEEAVKEHSLAMLEGWHYDPAPVIQEKDRIMEEKITQAVGESATLADAFREYNRLQQEYARRTAE